VRAHRSASGRVGFSRDFSGKPLRPGGAAASAEQAGGGGAGQQGYNRGLGHLRIEYAGLGGEGYPRREVEAQRIGQVKTGPKSSAAVGVKSDIHLRRGADRGIVGGENPGSGAGIGEALGRKAGDGVAGIEPGVGDAPQEGGVAAVDSEVGKIKGGGCLSKTSDPFVRSL
jgi:hypothetical protein